MKICLIYNISNKKYDRLACKVLDTLKDKKEFSETNIFNNIKEEKNSNIKIYSTRYDIYAIFSDSISEVKEYCESLKFPDKTILITQNITAAFLTESVNLVKDVIYSKNDIQKICSRIVYSYNKLKAKETVNV